jgi:glycosyltransferase involved in cell wall biosynthesis
MEKLRILLVADSCTLPTSNAEIIRLIFEPLLDRFGHSYEIFQVGLKHVLAVTEARWPVHSTRLDASSGFAEDDLHGEETVCKLIPEINPHLVVGVGEIKNLIHLCDLPDRFGIKLLLYTKIDSPERLPEFKDKLRKAHSIVTMSAAAKDLLMSCIGDHSDCLLAHCYPPADLERFAPISEEERVQLRKEVCPVSMPEDAFIIGWIGLNRWRKQLWIPLKVIHYLKSGNYLVCDSCGRVSLFDWHPLTRTHSRSPEDVLESRPSFTFTECIHCGSRDVEKAHPLPNIFLWMHMPQGDTGEDWPFEYLAWEFGVVPNEDLLFTPGYTVRAALTPENLATLYLLWDCLLYLSGSEAFGLPTWEAMAVGLPVIYTNTQFHCEHLNAAAAGIGVGGILQPERRSGHLQMIADVPQALKALRDLYFSRTLRWTLGDNGRTYVKKFGRNQMVEYWNPLLHQTASLSTTPAALSSR